MSEPGLKTALVDEPDRSSAEARMEQRVLRVSRASTNLTNVFLLHNVIKIMAGDEKEEESALFEVEPPLKRFLSKKVAL